MVVMRDGDGRPAKAALYDFKSDEVAGDGDMTSVAERYRPQMVLYRSALSRMLRLDPEKIALRLLFTHSGRVYDFSSSGTP